MKKLIDFIDKLSLRTKLVTTYIILIAIPILLLGWRYYNSSSEVIYDLAEKNAVELVGKNVDIVDEKLSQIMQNITSFITDKDMVDTFTNIDPKDDYNMLLMDNRISNIINKYFAQSQDIYSVQLATSYFVFGPRATTMTTVKSLIPMDSLINSDLFLKAKQQNGKILWIPTYDFGKMFNLQYLNGIDVDYKYMFSIAVEVNGTYFENGILSGFPANMEKPVLIMNFKEDFFQKNFSNSIPVKGSYFFVINNEGQIISHKNKSLITTKITDKWLKDVKANGKGTESVILNGKKMIICYNTSKITGWTTIAAIPPEKLVEPIIPKIMSYTVYVAVLLTIISIIFAYFMSIKITNPIIKLSKAIKKTGEGNFDLKLKEDGNKESRDLIHRFNIMNEKIQKLITENYESKIKEKEAEITALNLHLDPHFMYNTINLINLTAMENDQDEISEMLVSLSTMLKYTVKNRKDQVSFEEDLNYLKSYTFIMTKRFEGRFLVEFDIDPELYKYPVPKFLLQPFIENSMIHGFEGLKKMGYIKIRCWIDGEKRYYCVEDNGCGIDRDKLIEIENNSNDHIGINNVKRRIQILYGNEYGVDIQSELNKGTIVTISMPLKD